MFDFFPNEQSQALLGAARNPSLAPDPGIWTGFASGTGNYFMRSLAEAGRAVDMAGAAFPVLADTVTGGTERQDRYFREHDDVFNSAVDYWTPRPGEVGIAGQVAGQLAGGIAQAIVSPALLVGSAQLSVAEDLVRQGVDAGAANLVGDIHGLGMALGVRMPFLGKTLGSRVASGVGGNVAQGAAVAGASATVLSIAGNAVQAAQFDALDVKARVLDAMLGAAFGGLAHIQARPTISPTEAAAVLTLNQVHHMEVGSAPGRPATAEASTAHVQALQQAVDQLLRGEPVSVDAITKDAAFVPDPAYSRGHDEVAAEIQRLAREDAGPAPVEPITRPAADAPADADPVSARARLAAQRNPDMQVPTGTFAPDGTPLTARAADLIASGDTALADTRRTTPDLFRTAAACLLGMI